MCRIVLIFISNQHIIQLEASRAHFDEQIRLYGPQLLVNLVNKKGYELPMGQAYARNVEQLNDPRILYTHFDFHQECRKMRWHRIQLLLDQLDAELVKQGYCYFDASDIKNPVLRNTQTSVVRTNCMDCLDRTNVVQSTLARHILNQQLRELKILDINEKVEEHEDFMTSFRNSKFQYKEFQQKLSKKISRDLYFVQSGLITRML